MQAWKVQTAFGIVFALFGAIIIVVNTTTTLRCERLELRQVDCQLQRQMLGGITTYRETIRNVTGADVEMRESTPGKPVNENNSRLRSPSIGYRVILHTATGDVPLSRFGARDTTNQVNDINGFMDNPRQPTLTLQQRFPQAALGYVAGPCLFVPLLLTLASVLGTFFRRRRPPAKRRQRSGHTQR